ncbi:nucleotidyl transferase AbiEii/AbiGii toxin family protein [Embleya sp. NPDC008237]|uniref:nucleotidyl transferase AbiEii/AbiGii toxin family protein n=1 Tax=Embleya sp. NPDC008237 TaxID=3363978 RepID=UPI0036EF884B
MTASTPNGPASDRGRGIEAPTFADPTQHRRWWAARRRALEHALRLCTEGPSAGALVLRGSMPLIAWLGAAAREPGDLDWVVSPSPIRPVRPDRPHPHVPERAVVQQWPEVFAGAGAGDLWCDEEFDTRGIRACPPPEGTAWVQVDTLCDDPYDDEYDDRWDAEWDDEWADVGESPHHELVEALARCPDAGAGVVLDAGRAHSEGGGSYGDGDGARGVRLIVPWRADGLPEGTIRVDYAFDEWVPEPARWTAIPRAGGGPPVVAPAASRALSLAWKLRWLRRDAAEAGVFAKDLYDAVLLAESPHTRLRRELLGRVVGGVPVAPGEVASWSVPDWDRFRAAHPSARGPEAAWLARLGHALGTISGRPGPGR